MARQPARQERRTVTFASTLFLRPILDLLLAEISPLWRAEVRLGLQEALVNAACHGNCLDPDKRVTVHFSVAPNYYVWIIADEGSGFDKQQPCADAVPCSDWECGRGLFILRQIFDEVQWLPPGNQLRLCKYIPREARPQLS
nr:ATP-binding protein [Gloeobacter kilaueensis]